MLFKLEQLYKKLYDLESNKDPFSVFPEISPNTPLVQDVSTVSSNIDNDKNFQSKKYFKSKADKDSMGKWARKSMCLNLNVLRRLMRKLNR